MKALRIHEFGPDTMVVDEVEKPTPGEGEVLVRICATSINPIDWKVAQTGRYPVKLPFTLGGEFSGVVEKAGPGVTEPLITDHVFGMSFGGAHADYFLAKAANVAPKPASLDHQHAAGIPLVATTAWQALFDHGRLDAGQRVLIHAGAGGVGAMAVQLALFKNAHVFATASSANMPYLKELGVEHAIDYQTTRFEDVAHDLDLVFDLVGGETQERSLAVLKPGGILVSAVQEPDKAKLEKHGVHGIRFAAQANGAQLKETSRLVDGGELKVRIARTEPFARIKEAMALSQSGHPNGKIIITIAAE